MDRTAPVRMSAKPSPSTQPHLEMEATSRSCEFLAGGRCALGYHGGKPHAGNCRACIAAGENNQAHADRMPRFSAQVKSAAGAVARFARSGFAPTDAETLSTREETCRSCDQWDSAAINGTGRCRRCGCSTWAKLRMASEQCPLGKW